MQPLYLIIENYMNNYKILNHIMNNYTLILTTNIHLHNTLIINYDNNLHSYFIKIAKKYNGQIKQNFPKNNKNIYSIILFDINILEYLSEFYSNINYNIQNKLYQDFLNLYTNQIIYLKKDFLI